MDTITQLKSDLHRLIDQVNDENILNAIKVILARGIVKEIKKETAKETARELISNSQDTESKSEPEKYVPEIERGKSNSYKETVKNLKDKYHL